MTRAALTKLLILVILAFIICLPEFFTWYRAKVNFLCLPYRLCERGSQVKARKENGKIGRVEFRRNHMCNPSQMAEREMWEQSCTDEKQSNRTDPGSDSGRGGKDPENSWFMCETDTDMAELHSNMSSSVLKEYFEVSVELQLRDAETLNLTLYGRNNHSSLHLHPPEEEEEDEEKKREYEGQRKDFYCCLPAPPSSESANQSRCLLWLSNQTVLTATANETLPWKRTEKDEWRCMFRVLWLVLLCLVMLAIITTVLGRVCWRRNSYKKSKVPHNLTGRRLNDGNKHAEVAVPKGTVPQSYRSPPWSDLSTIHEVNTQDDIETLLDGNVDHCYTANLHHRGYPSTSSVTEVQAW